MGRKKVLSDTLRNLKKAINSIKKQHEQNKDEAETMIDKMMIDMEEAMLPLALTDEQENFFLNLAQETKNEILRIEDNAFEIQSQLEDISKNLSKHSD